MNEVLQLSFTFFGYAIVAVFAQNAVFTRGLGVSRLVELVGDERVSSWRFTLLLCVTQLLAAPLSYYASQRLAQYVQRAMLRPAVYVGCIALVCIGEHLVLWLLAKLRVGYAAKLLRLVPLAGFNSCVLGTVLVERTQSFTLTQSIGFGFGSAIGYLMAVLLVTEAQHRLNRHAIPRAFRGLPITLIYIGVLALAIYGFTGHTVIL